MNGHGHHAAAAAPMDIQQQSPHYAHYPPYHEHDGHGHGGQGLAGRVRRFFQIDERGSSIGREIRAGVVTFLTMSYILLVNPQILSQVGFAPSQVVVATALSSGVASILCGVFGNLPFGLAPGTGLSVYLTYGLVMADVMTKEQGMAACLLSGVLLGVCTLVGVANVVMRVTPLSIKLATVVGMGLLIALIGMVSIKLVVADPQTVVALGDLGDVRIWLSLAGLALTGSLLFHQVPGSILIGIIAITAIVWGLEGSGPTVIAQVPKFDLSIAEGLDFSTTFSMEMVSAVLAFIFVGIFDISGVMFGMGRLAKLTQPDETIPGSIWAFLASAIGSVVGGLTGSTPVIVQVETAAGINEGGRTGLTAVTIGALFLCSVFLAPLFGKVPQTATAPILVLVGAMMMGESKKIDWSNMSEAVPAYFTTVMMPFSYSITNGILFGIVMSLAFYLTTGDTIIARACALLGPSPSKPPGVGDGSVSGSGGGTIPTPTSHPTALRSPFLDSRLMERRPSLLLSKGQVDELDQEQRAEEQALQGHFLPIATVTGDYPHAAVASQRKGAAAGGGGYGTVGGGIASSL